MHPVSMRGHGAASRSHACCMSHGMTPARQHTCLAPRGEEVRAVQGVPAGRIGIVLLDILWELLLYLTICPLLLLLSEGRDLLWQKLINTAERCFRVLASL